MEATEKLKKMYEAEAEIRRGGAWLGAARNWMQCKKRNGETVTWRSAEVLKPEMTVKDAEDIARTAVIAYARSIVGR